MKLNISGTVHLLCLLTFIFGSCHRNDENDKSLRSVILISPEAADENSTGIYSGVIEEGKNVNASFMADGKISKILVKDGDRVSKGQLIAVLDDSDYQIGVNQLKLQFEQMTEEKKRMDEMFNRHNIAPNDYEKFTTGYEQLKLQLEMAENKLSYTRLYAPTSGYISEKFKEPGELVGAGTPIVNITDDSRLLASVNLPVSAYINRNRIVDIYGITPVYPDNSIPLTLESFTPDPSNNMLYTMKLLVPAKFSSELGPGMNISIALKMIETPEGNWNIPARAVFEESGIKYVWAYEPSDSTLHKLPVNITGNQKDKSLTVNGLNGTERIVETGVKQLYEGEKVNVVDKSDFNLN